MSSDDAAFVAWYRQAWGPLLAAVLILTRDADQAEDVLSEACTRTCEHWDGLDGASPTAWTYVVARNIVRSHWRRGRSAAAWLSRQHAPTATEPVFADPDVWAAVRDLPERARAVIAMRYVLDMTQADIAAALHIAPGTVASALHDARSNLRSALSTHRREGSRR